MNPLHCNVRLEVHLADEFADTRIACVVIEPNAALPKLPSGLADVGALRLGSDPDMVSRTNRVMITHEDTISWGYDAEIAARIAELDAPVGRVAAVRQKGKFEFL